MFFSYLYDIMRKNEQIVRYVASETPTSNSCSATQS